MIICVSNQKGGVGKTTLSLHLAAELARRGGRVKLIDLDPQSSALDWSVARDTAGLQALFEIESWPRPTLHKHISQKAEGYEHVVLDCPPQTAEIARSAIISADVVLIPVHPGPFDLWAARSTVELVEEASVYRPELIGAFVMSMVDRRAAISADVSEALAAYENMRVLGTSTSRLLAYPYAITGGSVAQEYAPNERASDEIRALTDELLQLQPTQEVA